MSGFRCDRFAMQHHLIIASLLFLAGFGATSVAQAAKYHLLWKWPTGIHEGLFDIYPDDIPVCTQVLANLNHHPISQPYSWLSPPEWDAAVTKISWDSIKDSDKTTVLKAQNEADCDIGFCANGRNFWDTKGKDVLQKDAEDKNLRMESATISLSADQPVKIVIRIHYTTPEDDSKIDRTGRFDSKFYEVVQPTPLKLVAIVDLGQYADAIQIGGKTYFYGYSTRSFDNYFKKLPKTQALFVLGEPYIRPGESDSVVDICQMAFH
jgi:hypothetical protein